MELTAEKAEFFKSRFTSNKFSSSTVSRLLSFFISLKSKADLIYTISPQGVILSSKVWSSSLFCWPLLPETIALSVAVVKLLVAPLFWRLGLDSSLIGFPWEGSAYTLWLAGFSSGVKTFFKV